ncbi:MAG: hypothetical protein ABFS32_12615 [Bacteroidota bacterium]
MKRFFKYIIVLSLFYGCVSNNPVHLDYYTNGELKLKKILFDKKDTNSYYYEEYYPSGELKQAGRVIDNLHDGVINNFHKDGTLYKRRKFKNGIITGRELIYEKDQSYWEEVYYLEGSPVQSIIHFSESDSLPQALKVFQVKEDRSTKPIGQIIYNDNIPIPEKSFYYEIFSPDYVTINKDIILHIEGYTNNRDNFQMNLFLQEHDSYGLRETEFSSQDLSIDFYFQPLDTGDIDLMGFIILKDTLKNESYHYLLCEEFDVRPMN